MSNIFDDFFKDTPEEVISMSKEDYVLRTQQVLKKIEEEYFASWGNRALSEAEYPEESICEKCTGCGSFNNPDEGVKMECFQDSEGGRCYYRYMDFDQFGECVGDFIGEICELTRITEVTESHPQ